MEPGDGEADPLTAFQTPREEPPIMMAVAEDTSDEVDTWIDSEKYFRVRH